MQEDVRSQAMRVIQNQSKVFDRKGRAIERSPGHHYGDYETNQKGNSSLASLSPGKDVINELRRANKKLIKSKDQLVGVEPTKSSKLSLRKNSSSVLMSDYTT